MKNVLFGGSILVLKLLKQGFLHRNVRLLLEIYMVRIYRPCSQIGHFSVTYEGIFWKSTVLHRDTDVWQTQLPARPSQLPARPSQLPARPS